AEQAVIGGIFLDPQAMSTAIEIVDVNDFFRANHQTIYRAMSELYDKGEPIDLLAVTNRLLSQQLIDDVGGVQYLTKVAQSVPTAANISYYCKIIEEKAVLRRLIQNAKEIITSYFEEDKYI